MNPVKKDLGRLYVVATPIGNLKDITFRAVECLRSVGLVAAEDTRRTRKLLSHLDISCPVISCHEHNELARVEAIMDVLVQGRDVALVSDAGSPGVSDPGARLIATLRGKGVSVIPIPGPSAVSCALSVAGMCASSYFFAGFLPSSPRERRQVLEGLLDLGSLLVFFEAPHRFKASLRDMLEILGDRRAFLAREMTKVHETYVFDTLGGLMSLFSSRQVKGEITLVVEGRSGDEGGGGLKVAPELIEIIRALVTGKPLGVKQVSKLLSSISGLRSREIYNLCLEILETEDGQEG